MRFPPLLLAPIVAAWPAVACATDAPAAPTSAPLASEIYVPVGLALYSGADRLAVGLGGGIGYRHLLGDVAALYGEARLAWYTGLVGVVALGATAGLQVRAWNPQLGIGALLFLGDGVRVLSSSAPDVPSKVAIAPAFRIAPLRFVGARFTAAALSTDIGCGISGQHCALALSVSLLETGIRF